MEFPQKSAMPDGNFRKLALAGALIVLALPTPSRADASRRISLTTYLRDGPGVRYRAADEAQMGTQVSVIGCANGWCNVAYDGVSGYVAQATLAPAADTAASPKSTTCFTDKEAGYHGGRDVRYCRAQTTSP
jgi:uncharacterized protein YgiM (DUF1202 family)